MRAGPRCPCQPLPMLTSHPTSERSAASLPQAYCGCAAALREKLRARLLTGESVPYPSRHPSAPMRTGPTGDTHDTQSQTRRAAGADHPRHSTGRRAGAYRVQEIAYGGLKPETVQRLEALGEQLDGGNPALRRIRGDDMPIIGTRLIREYQGVEHSVTVLHDGFEYQGRPYQSLSSIARAITGTRWNGWLFFGLKNRRAAA